jgi:hypothetical protein
MYININSREDRVLQGGQKDGRPGTQKRWTRNDGVKRISMVKKFPRAV